MINSIASHFRRNKHLWILALIVTVFAAIFMIPIYAILVISFKTTREVIFTPLSFPTSLYLENFKRTWKAVNFLNVYKNSAFIAFTSVCFRIVLASMAAFTLGKHRNKMNHILYLLFLSGLMIPIYTVLVPLLKLIKDLGLMNSHLGLIIVYCATGMPFAIFMLTGFIRSIPNELVEAAIVDGCSIYKIFWIIIFPLLKPAVTTLFILDFLAIWNDFLLPMLTLTRNSMKTITVAIYSFYGEYGSRWELSFSAYLLAIIPIVIVYLFLQRNIVNGILLGAVKG